MSTPSGNETADAPSRPADGIEAAEAAYEFATLIRKEAARPRRDQDGEIYEVRPCAQVRGFTLKLPVLGWKLWYPTANAAVHFARSVASVYRAECHIYNASGERDSQPSVN